MNKTDRPFALNILGFAILIEILTAWSLGTLAIEYPSLPFSDLNETVTLMKLNRHYRQALCLLSLAILIEPSDPANYISRGSVYGLMHEKEQGIKDELKAISLAQSLYQKGTNYLALAHQNLAGIYLNNKESSKAASELKLSLRILAQDPLTTERLATVLLKQNYLSEGMHYLELTKALYEQRNSFYASERVRLKISELQTQMISNNSGIIESLN